VGPKRDNFHCSTDKAPRIQEFNVVDFKHTSKARLRLIYKFTHPSSMETNLASDSDLRAEQQREELSINVNTLLESNRKLSRRLMNLEDAFDVRTIITKRDSVISSKDQVDPKESQTHTMSSVDASEKLSADMLNLSVDQGIDMTSRFNFEADLESSRVYRRAQRDTMDFSFRSSVAETKAWSILSGLSLGQISTIAVIALPVYPEDIGNPQHYDFGQQQIRQKSIKTLSQLDQSIFHECLEIKLQLSQIPEILDIFDAQERLWKQKKWLE
jgi:cell division control protein 24